jgi:hypothetical protein
MTYCVGIKLDAGLVFLSDSRTNAGLETRNIGAHTAGSVRRFRIDCSMAICSTFLPIINLIYSA